MQTPSPSNPLRKMCKGSFCHISPLSRYVMAEPEKKIRMSIDTGMVVVIFISLMYMVLVFGLLFYVKNDWCDLLFKNFTVGNEAKIVKALYHCCCFFRKILIVDHGTIQRQVISYILNRKNYLYYLDWPALTLKLEIVLDIHNSTYMQDLAKKHPRKDQRQHIFKYLLVQVGTSVSLAEDDSGETL